MTKDQLLEHNMADAAHPPLREKQAECKEKLDKALKDLETLREDQILFIARLVRLVASDMERDSRKKAAYATRAEVIFKRKVHDGESLEDAYTAAINNVD